MEPKSHQQSIKYLLWGPSGCRDAPRVRKGRPKELPDTKIDQKSSKKESKWSKKIRKRSQNGIKIHLKKKKTLSLPIVLFRM